MRKGGLENLALIGHIEGKNNRERKLATDLRLCEWEYGRFGKGINVAKGNKEQDVVKIHHHPCPESSNRFKTGLNTGTVVLFTLKTSDLSRLTANIIC